MKNKIKNKAMASKNIRSLVIKAQRGKKTQLGVTLVELTIVLIIIGVIVSVLYTQIGGGTDTNSIRGNNAFRHAKLVSSAAQLQQQTLGCIPIQALSLIQSATYNLALGNSCNAVQTALPAQFPFIRGVEVIQGNNNEFNLDDLDAGARGSLVETAGGTTYYQISATDAVARAIYDRCAGAAGAAVSAPAALTAGNPCSYVDVAGAANDQFGYFIGTD